MNVLVLAWVSRLSYDFVLQLVGRLTGSTSLRMRDIVGTVSSSKLVLSASILAFERGETHIVNGIFERVETARERMCNYNI